VRAALAAIVLLALFAPTAQAACDSQRVQNGLARSLNGCGEVDLGRGAEGAARQAVGRLSGALGVQRDTSDLGLLRARSTAGGPRVRFQQYVEGVPVRNGQVTVAIGTDGSVLHVASSASDDATLDTRARVGRREALLTARRRVPSGFDTVAPPTTTLVAQPNARGTLRLAWDVFVPARQPRGDWHVIVSAITGDVLEAYDAIVHVDGSALTYSPNPVQMTGNTALQDNDDADQAALTSARASFVLHDLTPAINQIRGTFADMASTTVQGCPLPYTPGQASEASRVYNYTRADNRFEEAQAYLALTEVQRTYEALGFPDIFSSPVRIDVHCIPDDNSFFSPGDNALHMGDGGVDDAEDSDVTVHEFGHATQAAQVPGFGPGAGPSEQQAIGEGFGDFLATSFYLETGNASYQAARRFCVMEWDATSYNPVVAGNPGSGCLRWVDGRDEDTGADIGFYPGTPREEHLDGRYWSAMLTCVFKGIEPALLTTAARDRMLTLVLAHNDDLVPTSSNAAFDDSLAALKAEDQARFNGDELALLTRCAEQRLGIGTKPVVGGALSPATPDGANGWYRSAPAATWNISDPESAVRTVGCATTPQVADTAAGAVTCRATSGGGTTELSLPYRKDATPPTLAAKLSATPRLGATLIALPNAADATSGVAGQSCGAVDTSELGEQTLTCTAVDNAGNQATQSLTFKVQPQIVSFRATRAKVARDGTVTFRLRASRSVRVKVSAKAGKVKFRSQSKRLTQGKNLRVTLKLSAKARAAFLQKLRGGKTVKVVVTLKPTGAKAVKLTLRVRRR
jgi:Fungalysin/Thermolysin Propeptide Motif